MVIVLKILLEGDPKQNFRKQTLAYLNFLSKGYSKEIFLCNRLSSRSTRLNSIID